ncbi:MAG: YccF domain-containing protein, partial [Oscillospiraceae bacterium]
MKFIGNILWFVLCGLILFLGWSIVGLLWCVTIVGIPIGIQCFKFAGLMFAPFGKEIIYGTHATSVLLNILWIVFGGIELAVTSVIIGLVLCVTIVGIPFGLQCF